MKSDFIIADEATSMLDAYSEVKLFSFFERYCEISGCGFVFVTHTARLRDEFADETIFF